MADFQPFKAWRYDPSKVNFEKVIAPPYDVISPEEQEGLYARDAHNCIRLILNRIEDSDTDQNNRYTRARDFFQSWQKEGAVVQESEPCFYYYRQTFAHPLTGETFQRLALLGRLKLEPFEKGVVVPHEKTLAKPKADRLKLLQNATANFSPIFCLYEDAEKKVNTLLKEVMESKPLLDATDNQKVKHEVWPIEKGEKADAIQQFFATKSVYIADGHHRYQTTLDYGLETRKQKNVGADEVLGSDFTLMALVEFNDPGMLLLPTHRMLLPFEGFEETKMLEALKPYFDIEPRELEALEKELESVKAPAAFGLCFEKQVYLLKLRSLEEAKKLMPPGHAEVWYGFDLNILAHFVLAKLWNLPEADWEGVLRFTHCSKEAVSSVKSGKMKATFLAQAPRTLLLKEMGEESELMPQKSTYFYPKLASGLVFYSHEA